MTKQHPDRLCRTCYEFDYNMNRKDGVSADMLVVCDHDEPVKEFFCITCFYNFDDNESFWHTNQVRLCPKCYPKNRKPECQENVNLVETTP